MAKNDDHTQPLANFRGVVRLFPLPNFVLFPHAVQPLHLFEARYLELMRDALADDQLIAMATLLPGWERDYEDRPPLHGVACLGRIVSHEVLPDGRFNLLLQGVQRVALGDELPPSKIYREAQAKLLDDVYLAPSKAARSIMQQRIVELVRAHLTDCGSPVSELDRLLSDHIPLGTLTDIFAHTLGFSMTAKQRLLAQPNVDRRAALLIDQLATLGRPPATAANSGTFPPPFSLN